MRSTLVRWILRAAILWAAERLARRVADRVGDDKSRPKQAVPGEYEVTSEKPVIEHGGTSGSG
jgi:hypothetical protein